MRWTQFSSREITINAFIGGGLTAIYGGFPVAVVDRRRVGGADEVLKSERCGMKMDPASVTPNLDEGCLVLWEFDCIEISKLCFRNAVAYLRYKSQLESFYKLLDPIRDSPTPGISEAASSLGAHAVSLGQKEMGDVMDLLLSPASKVLNSWFEGKFRNPQKIQMLMDRMM